MVDKLVKGCRASKEEGADEKVDKVDTALVLLGRVTVTQHGDGKFFRILIVSLLTKFLNQPVTQTFAYCPLLKRIADISQMKQTLH